MYLPQDICLSAFSQLEFIASGSEGKSRRERVSALRYLLALLRQLNKHNAEFIPLDTSQKDNREEFINFVGEVVSINDSGDFTNNFKDEITNTTKFGVGNNFLTTALKKDGPYPTRTPSLIDRNNEALSLNKDWQNHLLQYGDWNRYRSYLAIWLCRFNSFSNDDIYNQLSTIIYKEYGKELHSLIIGDDLENILNNVSLSPMSPVFDELRNKEYDELRNKEYDEHQNIQGYNKIFYGAPGTGKSHTLEEKVDGYRKVRTVFHPDTQYSDFVGSLKPKMEADISDPTKRTITYQFRAGPFTNALVEALNNPSEHVFLVIEEINRAPAAAVFGELFQLLDRKDGASKYEIDASDPDMLDYINEKLDSSIPYITQLSIPANLTLLATMNSSDQAVMPMDTAFKRRWSFKYIKIDFSNPDIPQNEFHIPLENGVYVISWPNFAQILNSALTECRIAEDRLMGPFFLTRDEIENIEKSKDTLSGKLFVYLWDDVLRHHGREKIFSPSYTTFGELSDAFINGKAIFNSSIESKIKDKGTLLTLVDEADSE